MATERQRLLVCTLCFLFTVACGSSSGAAAAASPSATSDAQTANYVALIHNYWLGILAADQATPNSNEASSACLGTTSASSPRNSGLVDPAKCRIRALAILAVQQQFLHDLAMTVAPKRFANDDQIFHSQIPLAVAALNTLVAAAGAGEKQATFDAASAYADLMLSSVTAALDEVDPTVRHY